MSDHSVNPESMTPDVAEGEGPLPYKRNPAGPCLMCWAPAGIPCECDCLALLPADEQLAHRDAVLDRTLAELARAHNAGEDLSYLDKLDGVGRRYHLAADCSLGAGRPRAAVPKRTLRRCLVLAVVGAVLALGALWAAREAKADVEWFSLCPSHLSGVASGDTSCAFADNVRSAFYLQDSWTVITTSPVTGKFYTMQCDYVDLTSRVWYVPKRCVGVNDAGAVLVVYIA